MKERSASVSVILYTSKTLSNGEHPLMIRVNKNGQRKYVSLGISCDKKLWDEKNNKPRAKHPKKDEIETIISKKIQEYRNASIDAKVDDKQVSAAGLVAMVEHPVKSRTILQFYKEVYEGMFLSGQIGNGKTYKYCYSSFKKFCEKKKKDFNFSELDYSFLVKYEIELRSRGVQENSLSIHFRTLRSLYNMAIKERIADSKQYPFETFKVSKFVPSANRRAITKDEVRKIESINLEIGSELYEARQLFLFIYYGLGINFVDVAKLRWTNRVQNRIIYIRSKTGKQITFALTEPLQQILNYWYPVTGSDNENYIFPILNRHTHKTPTQIDNRIHKMIGVTNKSFKAIGKTLGIKEPLTTYVARHTMANTLKRNNVPTAIISEAMGHKTEAITQNYLKSFENDVVDEAAKNSL